MEAGKLRHRITILSPVRAESAASGEMKITGWTVIRTTWAEIKPRSAYRREESAKEVGYVTHDISMRYNDQLQDFHRIGFGSRIFKLIGAPIDVDELGVELRSAVCEVTNGG